MRPRPPVILRRLLAACLPPGPVRDGLLGDLEELYAERRGRTGRVSADLWYVRQLLGVLPHYLPDRLGSGRGGLTTGARELRLAVRALWRSPGFSAVATLTLAVGIGALTGMFAVLEQTVLRPLPVEDQDELVVVWTHHLVREMPHFPFVGDAYRIVEEEAASLAGVAGAEWGNPTEVLFESPDGTAEVFRQTKVLGDFFGVLGIRPILGRTLRPEDDVPGAERVAVVSHDLWERRWGGDPDVVGATVRVGEDRTRVVGVLPEGFGYPGETQIWIALRAHQAGWGDDEPFPVEVDVVGRLLPGATPAAVGDELRRILAEHPDLAGTYQDVEPVVQPLTEVVLGDLEPTLLLLFGGAALVLLVACLNVSNLVLVRAAGHERGLAVRRALGASRFRLAREAMAEGVLLGGVGGLAGVALAWLSLRVVLSRTPSGLPRLGEVSSPDVATHLFALAVTGAVVLLLTLLPVVRADRVQPAAALRGAGGSGAGARARRHTLTVLGQTGLAVWAVATAVLLFRSLVNLQSLDPGFSAEDVTLVELHHPYPLFDVPPDLPDRMRSVAERLEALPWVEAATSSFLRPMAAAGGIAILGRGEDQTPDEARASNPYLNVEVVGPDYFRLLELPVVRGRGFSPEDAGDALPVAVVNRAVARALWPGEDPVGQRLMGFQDTWWTVVGVTEDTRYQSLTELLPTVYLPQGQLGIVPPRYLLVRTSGDGPLLPSLRQVLEDVDPAIRVKAASSLHARLDVPLAGPRFSVLILGILGASVLLLATVGVYGVMMARVRSRTTEMGVRMALGARPVGVRALVMRQGMAQAAAGAVLGGGAFFVTATLVEHLLFGIPPTDPRSVATAAALVLATALLACWIPAHRAATLDPARTLRTE